MRIWLALTLAATCLAGTARADMVVAAHTIRAQSLITASDIVVQRGDVPGAATPEQVIGQEARVALYAGRPIRLNEIGPPAVVTRNQIVTLVFEGAGLHIVTDGRALDRAGAGERVRVMNLSSRSTVTGRVAEDGRVFVSR